MASSGGLRAVGRSRRAVLLVVAALGCVAWLAASSGLFAADVSSTAHVDAALLARPLDGTPSVTSSGPVLVGTGSGGAGEEAAEAKRARGEPLLVRCLAPDGSPLPSAHVCCEAHPSHAARGADAWVIPVPQVALADQHGVARFESVPQDGTHVVRLATGIAEWLTGSGGPVVWSVDPHAPQRMPRGSQPRVTFLRSGQDSPDSAGEVFAELVLVAEGATPGEGLAAPSAHERAESAVAALDEARQAARVLYALLERDLTGRTATSADVPEAVVDGPEVTLRQTSGLPVSIRPIDVATGIERDDAPRAIHPSRADLASANGCPTWSTLQPGSGTADVSVRTGAVEAARLPASRCRFRVPMISLAARELVAEVPVWPEAEVRVFLPTAAAIADALTVNTVTLDGEAVAGVRAESLGGGVFLLRGIPHRPGADLSIAAQAADAPWRVHDLRLSDIVGERATAELVGPASPTVAEVAPALTRQAWAGLTATDSSRLRAAQARLDASGRLLGDFLVARKAAAGEPPAPATLVVTVNPAPGYGLRDALVALGDRALHPDGRGGVVFDNIQPGAATLLVQGAGPSLTVPVEDLEAGERRELTIDVPPPLTLDVTVVDELGREVPFAELSVEQASGLPWLDLQGSRQRIDPYVDTRGRRTLRGLYPGRVVVKARASGDRVGQAEIEAPEGGRERLRIVVARERTK